MKNAKALGFEGRKEKLAPALDATYDFPTMAQRSIATGWGKLDQSQRDRFIAAFRGLTLRTYATRFDGYDERALRDARRGALGRGTVIVRTVLHSANEDVQLDYRLRSTPAGWRVIDVYLSGTVSELALRRAEYTSVLEREGFDALVVGAGAQGVGLAGRAAAQLRLAVEVVGGAQRGVEVDRAVAQRREPSVASARAVMPLPVVRMIWKRGREQIALRHTLPSTKSPKVSRAVVGPNSGSTR